MYCPPRGRRHVETHRLELPYFTHERSGNSECGEPEGREREKKKNSLKKKNILIVSPSRPLAAIHFAPLSKFPATLIRSFPSTLYFPFPSPISSIFFLFCGLNTKSGSNTNFFFSLPPFLNQRFSFPSPVNNPFAPNAVKMADDSQVKPPLPNFDLVGANPPNEGSEEKEAKKNCHPAIAQPPANRSQGKQTGTGDHATVKKASLVAGETRLLRSLAGPADGARSLAWRHSSYNFLPLASFSFLLPSLGCPADSIGHVPFLAPR